MKNLFEKNDHKALIAGIVIGSIAAGAAAYLLLAGQFNRIRDSFAGGQEEEAAPDPQAYLQHPVKTPKTDRVVLQRHEILHDPEQHRN